MDNKLGGKVIAILIVIAFPLIIAFWTHIAGSYVTVRDFFGMDSVDTNRLKNVFVALMGLILSIITLFTPTKFLKSPLNYVAEQIAKKWENLKAVKDEPEAKKNAYVEIGINIIYLVILTASYYFIIKNIVKYDDDYKISSDFGVLTLLLFGVVIMTFLFFTSFVVGKLQEIEESKVDTEEEKQQKRTIWSIVMIIGVLTSLAIGNGLTTKLDDYFSKNNKGGIVNKIYQNLGGNKQNLGNGDEIDIFDDSK